MACDESTNANDAVTAALGGPQSVTVDGNTVTQHNLKDLIAVANREAAKCAARNPGRGLRFTQLKPPGAV